MEQLEMIARRAVSLSKAKASSKPVFSSRKKKVKIIALDKGIQDLLALALRVANSSASVLIQGESGTGKEVFPKIIHQFGSRKHGNYIAVNCGAIPEGTIDSELFGHEKGAFTGAANMKKGRFELADKGTLFLDEIGDISMDIQVRLLRVIQTRKFERVGASESIQSDFRLLTATNPEAGDFAGGVAFACIVINHDVVQLGVVMGDAFG